jgi:hypothetical protein
MALPYLAFVPTFLLHALASDATPRGQYVEARTAAVFAGACHYGSQFTTEGRSAVLGWRIESGEWGGVSLAGIELAAVLDAPANLADERDGAGLARSSVVIVDRGLAAEVERAALAWLSAEHGARLGTVLAVERADVRVSGEGERFALAAGDAVRLEGAALPERQCCKMPYQVWYEPLVPLADRLVGRPTTFAVRVDELHLRFQRPDENDAFFGKFGPAPSALPSGS